MSGGYITITQTKQTAGLDKIINLLNSLVNKMSAISVGLLLKKKLIFHPFHGKAIELRENDSVAVRKENYFEHSVIFSHRPVEINEVVAVKITKMTGEYCGPLKIGFTSVDPITFESEVPLGRDLQKNPGVWLRGTHLLHPMEVGSIIYFLVDHEGNVLHGMNGKEAVGSGVIVSGVDISKPLWVILEAYGSVQACKFVNPLEALQTQIYKKPDPEVDENNNLIEQ